MSAPAIAQPVGSFETGYGGGAEGEILFRPPSSIAGFLKSDKFINLIVGPVGSTKTTAGIIKISQEAKRVHPCPDGVRRSRAVWVRNTREQLRDTSIPDFLKWYPDGVGGLLSKTDMKFVLRFRSEDDTVVECEVLFRGLEDTNDVRRLLSLNASFGILDEFREINPDIFTQLQTRLGRYPDKILNGVGCAEVLPDGRVRRLKKLWGMSNAPDIDSFWEKFLSEPPENTGVFFQPSGMSPEADWLEFLDPDYYENIAKGKTEDWIDVYVHAKFGRSLSGQPVFRCFDDTRHIAKETINPVASPLVIGADAGLNPTAVITQQTYDGRVMVLASCTGYTSGMGALRFIRERLKPLLAMRFPNRTAAVYLDPTGFYNRAATDERSVGDIYRTEGFMVHPAKTNALAARISVVESYLTRTVEKDKPAILFDPSNADLIRAMKAQYRYRINTKGERDDEPDKNHPYSDYCDALQYACLQHDGGKAVGGPVRRGAVTVEKAPYRWAA